MKSNIKIVEKRGVESGKTLVILAGVHGNEVCGVNAFDRLIPSLKIKSGKIIFVYANLEAIKQNKRFVEKNLNRSFLSMQPPEIEASLEGRTAKEIIPYLDEADAILDIHASSTKDSIPFIICDESLIEEARLFNLKKLVCNIDRFEPGSTDYYMNLQRKPAFCCECGYLGDVSAEETAQKAIIDFLTFYGCIEGINQFVVDPEVIKITGLYKNKFGSFRLPRYLKDFEKMNHETLIGFDGEEKIYLEKNKIIIFARDRDEVDSECFLFGEISEENEERRNILKSGNVQLDEGGMHVN